MRKAQKEYRIITGKSHFLPKNPASTATLKVANPTGCKQYLQRPWEKQEKQSLRTSRRPKSAAQEHGKFIVIRRPSTDTTATWPAASTAAQTVARNLLLAAGLMLLASSGFAQDDYMMELEGAMEEVSPIVDDNPAPSPPTASAPVTNASAPQHNQFLDQIGVEMEGMESTGSQAVPENARDQFDSDLQDRMPGTFVLYKRLSDDNKTEVFSEYEMSGDYLRVRRKIIELRRTP
jgi:hypothetical protein